MGTLNERGEYKYIGTKLNESGISINVHFQHAKHEQLSGLNMSSLKDSGKRLLSMAVVFALAGW